MYFRAKNTLKNNYYQTLKHLPPCKVSSQWAEIFGKSTYIIVFIILYVFHLKLS
jgi:hypothetical protein